MSKATYHSNRGQKSALLLLKPNEFQFSATPVYVPRTAVSNAQPGDEIEVPDGYSIVDFVVDGETRTTEEGEVLKTLVWN